jgi:hypothetical protein
VFDAKRGDGRNGRHARLRMQVRRDDVCHEWRIRIDLNLADV